MEKIKRKGTEIFFKVTDFCYNHFLILLFILIVLSTSSLIVHSVVTLLVSLLLPLHIVLSSISLVKKSMKNLLGDNVSLRSLAFGYIGSVLGIIVTFAIVYLLIVQWNLGYVSYGACGPSTYDIESPLVIRGFYNSFYYSAMTFFTVGYGEMCPLGAAKVLAILEAWVGHFFTVVIMFLAMYYYTMNKMRRENGKAE